MIANLNKAVCACKKPGKIFYKRKWYCAVETYEGAFNLVGYCKTNRRKSK